MQYEPGADQANQDAGRRGARRAYLADVLNFWGRSDDTGKSSDAHNSFERKAGVSSDLYNNGGHTLYFRPHLQIPQGHHLEQASAQALILYLYSLPRLANRVGLEEELLHPLRNDLDLLQGQPVMPETVARAQTLVSDFEREIVWSMRRAGNTLWHQLLQLRLSIPGLLSLRSNLDLIDAISEPKQAIVAYEQVIARMQQATEQTPRAPRNRFYLCCATFLLDRALLLEYIDYSELRSCHGQIMSLRAMPEHLRTQALIRIVDGLSGQLKEAAYPINAVEADYLREEIRRLWESLPERGSSLTPGQELAIRNSAGRAFRLSNPYARVRAGRRALRHLELSVGLA